MFSTTQECHQNGGPEKGLTLHPGGGLTFAAVADCEPIACSLEPDAVPDRLAAWQSLLAGVNSREPVDGGVRLVFTEVVAAGELAELAVAEQACCRFFAFTVTVDERGLALEVRAPDEAQELVHSLFGAPA